jgi:ribonuclease D
LIAAPNILKITHAGENDYKIFLKLYGTLPQNVFDTQIADGFLTHHYPLSFKELAKKHLNINLDKGFKVSDWKKRPFDHKQIEYAIEDVAYLYDLYQILKTKLEEKKRFQWVLDECNALTLLDSYQSDPYKDLDRSRTFIGLNKKEQIFLLRMMDWRSAVAKEKNQSKNMIIETKVMYEVAKGIGLSRKALESHRIIPNWVTTKYWDTFLDFYQREATPEELKIVKQYSSPARNSTQRMMTMDLLISLLKYKAMEYDVSYNLIVSRSDLEEMKIDAAFFPAYFESGWRKELLGEEFVKWLKLRAALKIELAENQWIISMK